MGDEDTADQQWASRYDALVDELRAEARRRREQGLVPADFEERLDAHARSLAGAAAPLPERVRQALAPAAARPALTPAASGGARSAVQAWAARAVGHSLRVLASRIDTLADATTAAVLAVAEAVTHPADHTHADLVASLDEVRDRLAGLDRLPAGGLALADLRRRVEALEAALRPVERGWQPWYRTGGLDELDDRAGGGGAGRAVRAARLAEHVAARQPVLDLGCGSGDLLALLAERGVAARGVDTDAQAAGRALARGLAAATGDALEALAAADDRSLGAVVMAGVAERLAPDQLADVVASAADKLSAGGVLVVDSLEPDAFVAALARDPRVRRPVDPAYLEWLCRQAGFEGVSVERGAGDDRYTLVATA